MIVTIQFFAAARDIAGTETVQLELGSHPTVLELRTALSLAYPAMMELIARSAIAVNHEYAVDGTDITECDELALIPPVSGG
jgi:molybdopterin synthase sulfur carrier subunit